MGLELNEIYNSRADDYERLVEREDYEGNILKALNEIRPMTGLDVVELGAGTGRLTCMLAPVVRSIQAFDASGHMLDVARQKLQASGLGNWKLEVAEHSSLPVPEGRADLAISGWSLVYSAIWAKGDWRVELGETLTKVENTLRPGGTIIILETMGTGFETPHPPADLLDYFKYLDDAGFQSRWIRTDYKFASIEEANQLVAFFFGDEMLAKLNQSGPITLPECTGLWWKHI